MIYTISFMCHGKTYSNAECTQGKYETNQYEAAAIGLISCKLEQEGISEDEKLIEVCLIEQDEVTGVSNPVWCKDVYYLPLKNVEL